VPSISGLTRSRREALEVHRLDTPSRPAARATSVEQAWAGVTCERALSGIRAGDVLGPLAELTAHDDEHGTMLAATLAAWLDHPGDPKAAARELHVHPNTLRYRMQRLPLDADLTDPETRLALRLQLRSLGH
jgi:sugar diacid utilization regulator